MKNPNLWGFTPGERRALLLICAALLVGIVYRIYRQSIIPEAMPLTAEDSTAIVAIAAAAESVIPRDLDQPDGKPDNQNLRPPTAAHDSHQERIDLNSADAQQLESLPGIGPVLAKRIIETRVRLRGFRSVEDLLTVPGIGMRRLEQLRPLVVCTSSQK